LHQFPRANQDIESDEVDFGPSTDGRTEYSHDSQGRIRLHPVPTSADNGSTFDWSLTSASDSSDRRWTLSMSKRKGKEKEPLVSRSQLEKQEKAYAGRCAFFRVVIPLSGPSQAKIARIRNLASAQTMRKVQITGDQLARRYNLLGTVQNSTVDINFLKAARWLNTQDQLVKTSLESSEPLTWLKHLEKRRVGRSTERVPWHLSSLILEEYYRTLTSSDAMLTETSSRTSKPVLVTQNSFHQSPQSRDSSRYSLPSLTRNKSTDGRISFEPLVESPRHSFEAQSHHSADSGLSSLASAPSGRHVASASSSRLRTSVTLQMTDRSQHEDDDKSSAHHSLSEASDYPSKNVMPQDANEANHTSESTTLKPGEDINKADPHKATIPESGSVQSSPNTSRKPPGRTNTRRSKRLSFPANDRLSVIMEQNRQREAEQVQADHEYERKAK
jgi:hypothetical protein